jgi:asparagine synthase (glutamine-hydrolysing)
MCGIAGILYSNKEKKAPAELISRMTDTLVHRGPDDKGIYVDNNAALGFRRLSIIDLSAAAHQPMGNEDGTIWGVFNGEIYNFKDLRVILEAKGHCFKSRCDSEVLIHAYEEYGTECVKHFNGMFAFAVWDSKKQLMFCGRDRTGEKPFFYYQDHDKFIFASEIKAILQDANLNRDIDHDSMNAYFSYMYVPEPRTIFKEIKKLDPASILVYRQGQVTITRYWNIEYGEYSQEHEAACAE